MFKNCSKGFYLLMTIVLAMVFNGCWNPRNRASKEMRIYRTVIGEVPDRNFVVSNAPTDALGIIEPTDLQGVFPAVSEDLASDFLAKNWEEAILEGDRETGDLRVMNLKEQESLADLPHYYWVSRVGFDRAGKRALVYWAVACAPLCSDSAFYLLERNDNGQWVIIDKLEGVKS